MDRLNRKHDTSDGFKSMARSVVGPVPIIALKPIAFFDTYASQHGRYQLRAALEIDLDRGKL